jgi:hypothetical protein
VTQKGLSQRPPAQRPNPRPQQILKNLPPKRKGNPGGKRKRPPGLPILQRRIQKPSARDILQKFSFTAACHRILIFFS